MNHEATDRGPAEASIPDDLKRCRQFVVWRHESLRGEPTMAPYNPRTKRRARVYEPYSWGTYEEALNCYHAGGFSGIGFVLFRGNGLCGIDLEGCVDRQEGTIQPWAQAIIDRFGSYTQLSPSGTGVQIIVKGKPPSYGKWKGQVELRGDSRLFPLTGPLVEGSGTEIAERPEALKWLLEEHLEADSLKNAIDELYRLAREGKIPHIRVGRLLFFDSDALTKWTIERSWSSSAPSPGTSDDRVSSTQGENGGPS